MHKLQSEIQQILLIEGVSPSSAFATQYIEDQLQASLRALLLRLRALSLACPGAPLIGLLLILLRHDHTLHYRLSLYLSYTDARKKGRESAFGFTELEPANAGAGAAAAEDAWNGQELRAQDNLDFLYTSNERLRPQVQIDVLSMFETHAAPLSSSEKQDRLLQSQSKPNAGWEPHMRRLWQYDQRARRTQTGEYVQLEEARAQAGFGGSGNKRFREFVGPHLALLDSSESSGDSLDDFFDALAFLSKEIVIRLIEAGSAIARRRVQRVAEAHPSEEEAKLKLERAQQQLKRKRERSDAGGPARKKEPQSPALEDGKDEQEKEEAEAARRAEEANSRPLGPFSGPSSSAGGGGHPPPTPLTASHSRAGSLAGPLFGEPPNANEEATPVVSVSLPEEAEKRDPVVGSDIVSPNDLLLGDLEEAALGLPPLGAAWAAGADKGLLDKLSLSKGWKRASWRQPALRVR